MTVDSTDVERHLDILGMLSYVIAALTGAVALIILFTTGVVAGFAGGAEVVILAAFLVIVLAVAGLYVAVGYGLRARRSWAKLAGLIAAVLALFNFPLGTAYGVYGLWVLLQAPVDGILSE